MELISALLHAPRVLFLDEPTIGLDVTSQEKVREFLRTYNQGNKVVTMLTSHYMQDIEALCERVIIIDEGRLFFDGPLTGIIDRFATHKIVSLTFAEVVHGDFAVLGEIVEQTAQTLKLKVPRARVSDTCREILTNCRVTDIGVQEPPVEEVIRQLFREQHDLNGTDAASSAEVKETPTLAQKSAKGKAPPN
jgi:ABC-2 type transport system ATP-binding protein